MAEIARDHLIDIPPEDHQELAQLVSRGGEPLEERLRFYMPMSDPLVCGWCEGRPKMKRYSWRPWKVVTRTCDECKRPIPHNTEQYGCPTCDRKLCLDCAVRERAASLRRGSEIDEPATQGRRTLRRGLGSMSLG